MPHPIDPQTPEVLTARFLWDAAKEGNVIIFLNVWERMIAGHYREIESSYDNGMNDLGKYDDGYNAGLHDGHEQGYDLGYEKAKKEAEASVGQISRASS